MRTPYWLLATGALALAVPAAHAQVARPAMTQYPAHPGNYTRASRAYVSRVVIHKAQGNNSAGWSANPAATSSSHYDVHKSGQVFQCVQEKDIAWHAGNWTYNATSIGIEHGGYAQYADTTDIQYRNSAHLVAWICVRHRIPIDRAHIIGHAEVPHPTIPGKFGGRNAHWDPGPHWQWDRFINLVRSYAGGAAPPSTAPAPAPAPGTRPTLRHGDRSIQVAYLQNKLRDAGFDPGPTDGHFGNMTLNAVRRFQQARGLTVDGVVGPQTWGELEKAPAAPAPAPTPPPAAPAPAPAPAPTTRPTLRHGDRSIQVAYLQNKLRAAGFDPGPTDGHFGNMTLAAVRRFQQARGLVVDGVVGPQTWGSLEGAPAAPAAPAPPPAAPAPAPAPVAGSRPTLRFGARSIQVAYLQNKLRAAGFDPGPTDGYFGNQTLAAVRRYQQAHGLTVDGVVGPQTWGSLGW